MINTLFVCTGNTCRSPMAEAILRDFIGKNVTLQDKLSVGSAGIMAYEGDGMMENAMEALSILGVRAGEHRAQRLTEALVDRGNLILAMEERHVAAICSRFPGAAGKTFTLHGYVGEEGGVRDPYGQPLAEYLRVAEEMRDAIERAIPKIKKLLDA